MYQHQGSEKKTRREILKNGSTEGLKEINWSRREILKIQKHRNHKHIKKQYPLTFFNWSKIEFTEDSMLSLFSLAPMISFFFFIYEIMYFKILNKEMFQNICNKYVYSALV